MRQKIHYKFDGPPDPSGDIMARELVVLVNGQRNPAQPIKVAPTDERVLLGTFDGGEEIEVRQTDISRNRRRTPVATETFTVKAPTVLAAPSGGTFEVEEIFEPGEIDETAENPAEPAEGPETPVEGPPGDPEAPVSTDTPEAGETATEGTRGGRRLAP